LVAGVAGAVDDSRLSVTATSGAVVLTWSNSPVNWLLEESPGLEPPIAWAGVWPGYYQTNATSRFVLLSAPDTNRFYRLRNAGPPVAGLTGYWPLDEDTSALFGDASGSGGGFLSVTNTQWRAGRIGTSALQFNGGPADAGGSRAWLSNSSYRILPPTGQPFSVSLWFNPDALTTGSQGIVGNDTDGSNGWQVVLQTVGPGTNFLVWTGLGGTGSLSVTARTLLLPGQWHQLTVTYDGIQGRLYLDSVLLASAQGALPTHAGPIYFGGGLGQYDSFLGEWTSSRPTPTASRPSRFLSRPTGSSTKVPVTSARTAASKVTTQV
jgi:hypothetical protein